MAPDVAPTGGPRSGDERWGVGPAHLSARMVLPMIRSAAMAKVEKMRSGKIVSICLLMVFLAGYQCYPTETKETALEEIQGASVATIVAPGKTTDGVKAMNADIPAHESE